RKEILEMVASYQRLFPQSDWGKEIYGRGRSEGQSEFLLKLLRSRFGELPGETIEHVKAADGDHPLCHRSCPLFLTQSRGGEESDAILGEVQERMVFRMVGPEGLRASALSREAGVAQPTLSRWPA
ncbi:MAG: hypothetical protein AAFU79_18340, partial [Myxococcota bacterium]